MIVTRRPTAHEPNCSHLGVVRRDLPAGLVVCGSQAVQLHWCDRHNELVTRQMIASQKVLNELQGIDPDFHGRNCANCRARRNFQWLTRADLSRDVQKLAAMLPWPMRGIAGIPRSGMRVAADLAMQLSVPLFEASRSGLRECGHGYRLDGRWFRDGPLVVVDDSVNRGTAMTSAVNAIDASNLVRACVYCRPESKHHVDLCARELPMPHYFEWHFFGSPLVKRAGFDIDGVIFHEQHHGPLWIPRPHRVPLIATGRPERHRAGTEAWLRAQGVNYDRLVMAPGHEADTTGRHKAEAYRASPARLFFESDPRQSKVIADIAGKPVICPQTGDVFQ